MTAAPVLSVAHLTTRIDTPSGTVTVVDDLSFTVGARETLGVVGESGCGKSMTALSILRLYQDPPIHIGRGAITFDETDLATMPAAALRDIRGNRIAMIFQEPMTALNPVMTIGRQIAEPLRRHTGLGARAARRRAVDLLDRVRIPDPQRRVDDFPHQLSGGMRQRAMIAIAIACEPRLLIADEPTTALDVTIQAQILALIRDLMSEFGMATILITHNLGVVAETADRVMVMYAGRKVEEAPVAALFANPLHPYTKGLLASVPVRGKRGPDGQPPPLADIAGVVPSLHDLGDSCAFAPRCAIATDRCRSARPDLRAFGEGHTVACFEAARPGGTIQ